MAKVKNNILENSYNKILDTKKNFNQKFTETGFSFDKFNPKKNSLKINLKKYQYIIKKIKKNKKVLEIGVGGGFFLAINKKKINYTGIDACKNLIEFFKIKFKKDANRTFYKSYFPSQRKYEKQDIIFSISSIQEKYNVNQNSSKFLKKLIDYSYKFLNPNGYLIFDFFNKDDVTYQNINFHYFNKKKILNIGKKFNLITFKKINKYQVIAILKK